MFKGPPRGTPGKRMDVQGPARGNTREKNGCSRARKGETPGRRMNVPGPARGAHLGEE